MTEKLKIIAIRPYPVWVGTRNQMLARIETGQGSFGGGCALQAAISAIDFALHDIEGKALPVQACEPGGANLISTGVRNDAYS